MRLGVGLAMLVAIAPAFGVTVRDDRHQAVTVTTPVRRIVTLSPNTTELVYEIGAADRLVGTVEFSDFPAAARQLPRVGNATKIDMERLLSLRPDLVIAWLSGNSVADINSIEALGIPVFALEAARLSAVPGQIRRLGLLLQTEARAEADAGNFERELGRIQQQYRAKRAVTVFYQIWQDPLMTLSSRHIISDAIHLCGGINPVIDRHALAPAVTIESVLAMDPQLIIVAGQAESDSVRFWQRWPGLQAVQAGNVFRYTDDALARPTSRMLPAVRTLCRTIDSGRQHIEHAGRSSRAAKARE